LVGHGKKRIRFGSKGKKIEDFVDLAKTLVAISSDIF